MTVATDCRSYQRENFLFQIWMPTTRRKDILGISCLFLPMSFLGIGLSEPRTVLSANERKSDFSFLGNMHVEFINVITIFRTELLMENREKVYAAHFPPCFILFDIIVLPISFGIQTNSKCPTEPLKFSEPVECCLVL